MCWSIYLLRPLYFSITEEFRRILFEHLLLLLLLLLLVLSGTWNGAPVAVKVLQCSEGMLEGLLVDGICHPNVVSVYK